MSMTAFHQVEKQCQQVFVVDIENKWKWKIKLGTLPVGPSSFELLLCSREPDSRTELSCR